MDKAKELNKTLYLPGDIMALFLKNLIMMLILKHYKIEIIYTTLAKWAVWSIGRKTLKELLIILRKAQTSHWNKALRAFEMANFAKSPFETLKFKNNF
ncbi:phosphoglycerate kinase, partial [Brachyspira hyodysenteriae]|nr:phosphoglycerate kinase [Brachyspira hyodysenteriae]